MAHATVKGKQHDVRVIRDLGENWSLEIFPTPDPKKVKTAEPFKPWPVPLCLKICADSREDALLYGLEHLKQGGKIDDFHLEASERPVPAAPKVKKDDDEEEKEEE